MSLLLNLINYSSSLQSEYRLSIPKQDEKDQRAKSLHYVKLNQQNQRAKMSSRSLSKLFPEKPQSNLNPKTRILHRIHHILSLKCKKHYYALFVTLETLKKKNLYLNSQGQFQKLQNRKLQTKISEKEKKISREEEKKIGISKLFNKIQEIQKIYLIKQFQQHIKLTFFKALKNHLICDDRIQKLVHKVQILHQKLKKYHTLKKLKKINHFCFKIQIISTLIDSLTKKYAKKKRQLSNCERIQIFQKIKSTSNNLKIEKDEIQNSFAKVLQKDQCVNLQNIENETNLNFNEMLQQKKQIQNIPQKLEQKKILSFQEILLNQNQNAQQKLKFDNQTEESSPNKQINLKQIKPLQNLMTRLIDEQKRKFQRNQSSVIKSLFIKTQFDQKPMIIQKELQNDQTSNFCKKIPKNYIRVCYNDFNEEFNLFSNNDILSSKTEFPLSVTNVFKQSRVTPYRNKKNSKCADNSTNQMLIPLEFKQEEISSLSISNISQVSMLKTQKSTNTLFNDKSLNFSAIGTEAVNFKNSLVHQRQSLKQGDRNFMKKRPNNPQQQITMSGKSFLRSTLDSKTKNKLQEKLLIDRTYSKDKVSQNSGRLFILDNDLPQISRSREPYWTRPSSPRVQNNRQQKEVQKDHVVFSNNTSFIYQNMTIYPTRDDSSFITAQKPNKSRIQNLTQPYVSQKNSKEKSFIKLLSKKQIPFIKQSK